MKRVFGFILADMRLLYFSYIQQATGVKLSFSGIEINPLLYRTSLRYTPA